MSLETICLVVGILGFALIVLQMVAQTRSDERLRAEEADAPYAEFYRERAARERV